MLLSHCSFSKCCSIRHRCSSGILSHSSQHTTPCVVHGWVSWIFEFSSIYSSKKQCQLMTSCFSKRFINFVTSVSAFVKSPELLRPSFKMLFKNSTCFRLNNFQCSIVNPSPKSSDRHTCHFCIVR